MDTINTVVRTVMNYLNYQEICLFHEMAPFLKSPAGVDSRAPGFEQHAEIDDFEIVAGCAVSGEGGHGRAQ